MNASEVDAFWQAEYQFYHRIISEEVDRLRFNQGFEHVEVDLYATSSKSGPAFVGTTRIGRTQFRSVARWSFDPAGKKILRVHLFPQP